MREFECELVRKDWGMSEDMFLNNHMMIERAAYEVKGITRYLTGHHVFFPFEGKEIAVVFPTEIMRLAGDAETFMSIYGIAVVEEFCHYFEKEYVHEKGHVQLNEVLHGWDVGGKGIERR
jgi:hypothetical protein